MSKVQSNNYNLLKNSLSNLQNASGESILITKSGKLFNTLTIAGGKTELVDVNPHDQKWCFVTFIESSSSSINESTHLSSYIQTIPFQLT